MKGLGKIQMAGKHRKHMEEQRERERKVDVLSRFSHVRLLRLHGLYVAHQLLCLGDVNNFILGSGPNSRVRNVF